MERQREEIATDHFLCQNTVLKKARLTRPFELINGTMFILAYNYALLKHNCEFMSRAFARWIISPTINCHV